MNKLVIAVISIFYLVNLIECAEIKDIQVQYKSNVTYDCSDAPFDVEFFKFPFENDTLLKEAVKVEENDKYKLEDNKLFINDLRKEEIYAKFECRPKDKTEPYKSFKHNIKPFLYKPEKASQTITEGGSVELVCKLLYGNENDQKPNWEWSRNGTVLQTSERFKVDQQANNETSNALETKLVIKDVKDDDKGVYVCRVWNDNGEFKEQITLRVKDAYAALWPFLAIVAEVVILCAIILIYEKKCTKKPSNEDENEQQQTLMDNRDNQNIDLKKRTAKA